MPESHGNRSLLQAGKNCWRIAAAAGRVAFLIDGDAYFSSNSRAGANFERKTIRQ
jgi:hypothetical protein